MVGHDIWSPHPLPRVTTGSLISSRSVTLPSFREPPVHIPGLGLSGYAMPLGATVATMGFGIPPTQRSSLPDYPVGDRARVTGHPDNGNYSKDMSRTPQERSAQVSPKEVLGPYLMQAGSPQNHGIILTQDTPKLEYLTYAPDSGQKGASYAIYSIRLGFNDGTANAALLHQFKQDIREHVDPLALRFLRKTDNGKAFHKMVSDFLEKHGEKYWGQNDRSHLAEPDTSKGFLFPRDAHRDYSVLLQVLEDLFTYKANCLRRNEEKKREDLQVLDHVDFSTMCVVTPKPAVEAIKDAKKHTTASTEVVTRSKTRRTYSHTASDTESDPDSDIPLSRATKRRRLHHSSKQIRHRATQGITNQPAGHRKVHKHSDGAGLSETPRFSIPSSTRYVLKEKYLGNRNQVKAECSQTPLATVDVDCSEMGSTRDLQIIKPNRALNDNVSRTVSKSSSYESKSSAKPIKLIDLVDEDDGPTIKVEPLSAKAMGNTFFIVTASSQPSMAPVTVVFASCQNFQSLFSTLIAECGIQLATAKGTTAISATFTWSGKKHRIRKERQQDWTIFCNVLRKAWESHPEKFADGCEVEMLIHV